MYTQFQRADHAGGGFHISRVRICASFRAVSGLAADVKQRRRRWRQLPQNWGCCDPAICRQHPQYRKNCAQETPGAVRGRHGWEAAPAPQNQLLNANEVIANPGGGALGHRRGSINVPSQQPRQPLQSTQTYPTVKDRWCGYSENWSAFAASYRSRHSTPAQRAGEFCPHHQKEKMGHATPAGDAITDPQGWRFRRGLHLRH